MKSQRLLSIVTGILFIIGTASGITGAALSGSALNSADYLSKTASDPLLFTFSALLFFIMGASCAGIGLSMYPVLKRFSPGLAIGSAGFRIIEGVFAMLGFVILLTILSLGMKFIKADSLNSDIFQISGDMLMSMRRWISVASLYAWCFGALMYYWIFLKTKLVPLWLSVWGIAAIMLALIANSLDLFQAVDAFSPVNSMLNFPIALQEMVLAVWLIVKGYKKTVIESQSY